MKRFSSSAIAAMGFLASCSAQTDGTEGNPAGPDIPRVVQVFEPYLGVWESGSTGRHRAIAVSEDGQAIVSCIVPHPGDDWEPTNRIEYVSEGEAVTGFHRSEWGVETTYTGYPVPAGGGIDWDILGRSGDETSQRKETWSAPSEGMMDVVLELENSEGELVITSDQWFFLSDLEASCE